MTNRPLILGLLTFLIAALALTQFLGSKVESSPIAHLLELLIALLILLILSVVTWKWLGGRESN